MRSCTVTKVTTETLRISFRRHLRDEALRAAHRLTIEKGWERVRVAEVAALIGVSRPMIYKEFGDKQGLGDALVVREAERFSVGIQAVLDEHAGQAAAAITQAVRFALDEAEASPLLKAVLTSSRADSEAATGVLPLLATSRSLIETVSNRMVTWFMAHFPELNRHDVVDAVDAMIRLAVSHLVLPAANSVETGRRISTIALRYLSLEP